MRNFLVKFFQTQISTFERNAPEFNAYLSLKYIIYYLQTLLKFQILMK